VNAGNRSDLDLLFLLNTLITFMAQSAANAAVEALSILAKGLLASNQPFQAIKCLEAVCHSSTQMPVAAAKTRLWLSQLLLQHTQNINEATQHLQQAVSLKNAVHVETLAAACKSSKKACFAVQQLLLKQVPGCHALKCQVLSELGRCQRYLARPKLEIAAYERGLQMCISGQKSAERCPCCILNDLQCPAS